MHSAPFDLGCGDTLSSPAGRLLRVRDVFVPKHHAEKSRRLPARFRQCARKVVVFDNGAIAPLRDIQQYYTRIL